MKKYILGIDQGTTSTRAILVDKKGNLLFKAQREVECLYPQQGWVEADPMKIFISVVDCISEVLIEAGVDASEIASIGITNQRETTVVYEKKTGKPVYNAIVWQSKQTQDICDAHLKDADFIQTKTGLRINPYFSASKIRFILDKIPNGQKRAEKGELLFGTIDTWIISKLTNNKSHVTDVSNASRTLLFNIFDMKWDEELAKLWNIPMCMLPKVLDNSDDFGEATKIAPGLHINGVAGDQQAALYGQCCFNKGEAKNTYGTGCFMLMNIGDKPLLSNNGLLTTVAWREKGITTYALEGSIFIGGAVVQWMRDQLKFIEDASDSEHFCGKVKDCGGVYVVPAFVGLGTPYWDNDARGAIFGLTRATNAHHIGRAALLSIAYQSKDLFETMKKDVKAPLKSLKVDGGSSVNSLLMQFQSDILGIPVHIPACLETTVLGACYFAGLGCKFWKSKDEILAYKKVAKVYKPGIPKKQADELYAGWQEAIKATRCYKPHTK